MSQVQADYTATLAKEQTEIEQKFSDTNGVTYQDITVKEVSTISASLAKDTAEFVVSKPGDNENKVFGEITEFAYCNGNYTAKWNMTGNDKGWKVVKVASSTPSQPAQPQNGEGTTGTE